MLARSLTATITLAAATLPRVAAHGYPKEIKFGSTTASTWHPFDDPYASPVPDKITRKFNSDGPVEDLTSKAITCNTNGDKMDVAVAVDTVQKDVKAGDDVTFVWTPWLSDHKGPVLTYMANCDGDCSKFDGTSGNVWFKIDAAGLENGKWASDKLIDNGSTWTVKIPSSLAAGQYLLRHEILALHGASKEGGAQFYPSCNQISLTSSGSEKPHGVALPGAYKANDPGILVDIWADNFSSYTIPGPAVFAGSGSSASSGGQAGSNATSTSQSSSDADTDDQSGSDTSSDDQSGSAYGPASNATAHLPGAATNQTQAGMGAAPAQKPSRCKAGKTGNVARRAPGNTFMPQARYAFHRSVRNSGKRRQE